MREAVMNSLGTVITIFTHPEKRKGYLLTAVIRVGQFPPPRSVPAKSEKTARQLQEFEPKSGD
jgi:hypothetical protein